MDFDFDDEPKKKKKKKPKKVKKKPVIQTREFYETRITELNGRLAGLRTTFTRKIQVNNKLIDELVGIEEDREDVCEYLERTIKDRKLEIVELHNTLMNIQKDLEEYNKWLQERIIELQKKYDTDHKLLLGEIELGQKALQSLDEYRLMRDKALARYETSFSDTAKLERQAKEDLFNMEQKAVVQKNVLEKEVETRLQYLAQDFMHSNEIRNASYTRNLIQENITLKKRLDKIVKQNIRTMEEREKQHLKTKEIIESYTSLEQLTEQLRRTIDNKNDIIQNLAARIDRLRTRYIGARRFRRLYEMAESRGLFDVHGPKDFQEVTRYLDRLTFEKNTIIHQQRSQDNEIQQMRNLLYNVLATIERTSMALQNLAPGDSLEPTERRTAIGELIFLTMFTSHYFDNTQSCSSAIYRPGVCGFIQSEKPFDEESLTVLYRNMRPRSRTDPSGRSDPSKFDNVSGNLEVGSFFTSPSIDECSSEETIFDEVPNCKSSTTVRSKIGDIGGDKAITESVGTLNEFRECIRRRYMRTSESDYDILLTWQYLQRIEETIEKEKSLENVHFFYDR